MSSQLTNYKYSSVFIPALCALLQAGGAANLFRAAYWAREGWFGSKLSDDNILTNNSYSRGIDLLVDMVRAEESQRYAFLYGCIAMFLLLVRQSITNAAMIHRSRRTSAGIAGNLPHISTIWLGAFLCLAGGMFASSLIWLGCWMHRQSDTAMGIAIIVAGVLLFVMTIAMSFRSLRRLL